MATPKTSGFLNNCGVNAALHIILANIEEIAKNPESKRIPAIVKEEHNKLLTAFNKCYQVDATPAEFIAYINSLNNHYAQQVVMGPVLRDYMKLQGAAEELTTIQGNGRYKMLDLEKVSNYLCKPLGISIIKNDPTQGIYEFSAPNPIKTIEGKKVQVQYKHNNAHFQAATPDLKNEQLIDDYEQLYARNPALHNAVNLMGGDKETTKTGLDGICQVVKKDFQLMRSEQLKESEEIFVDSSISEQEKTNYIDLMKDYKKQYQDFSGKLGFFAEPLVAQEPVKMYKYEEEVSFASKEEQEAYDEKLAIQLQKKEFQQVSDEKAFDETLQIQSDEEFARELQSRLSF